MHIIRGIIVGGIFGFSLQTDSDLKFCIILLTIIYLMTEGENIFRQMKLKKFYENQM